MSQGTSKISIKINNLEISMETPHESMIEDISNILELASNFMQSQGASPPDETEHLREQGADMSTTTIASRLKATTGPDLAVAAAARLTIFERRDSFTRAQLLAAMKLATGHYKSSMASNLSSSLKGLVRNTRFNETGSGTYTLTASERSTLEATLRGQA